MSTTTISITSCILGSATTCMKIPFNSSITFTSFLSNFSICNEDLIYRWSTGNRTLFYEKNMGNKIGWLEGMYIACL